MVRSSAPNGRITHFGKYFIPTVFTVLHQTKNKHLAQTEMLAHVDSNNKTERKKRGIAINRADKMNFEL